MVLVDSSVWMEAARRNGRLECKIGLEALIEEAEALICGPIRMDVLAGARPEDRPMMATGFESIPYQAMSDEDWGLSTLCAGKLADHGYFPPFRDVLIASLALKWDCRIYTLDPVFEMMQEPLGIRLYLPGYGGKFQPEPPRPALVVPPQKKEAEILPSTMNIGVWD